LYAVMLQFSFDPIKNGYYIPFVHLGLYLASQEVFISTEIALKMYPANYFSWFGEHYDYLPKNWNWCKQFIRFTDTGYLASFIYIFYPAFFPVAYNVHFGITAGYWSGRLILGMDDKDILDNPAIDHRFESLWSAAVHGVPLILLTYRLVTSTECHDYFTYTDMMYSYGWNHTWLLCVYVPWCIYTGDPVYTILANETPLKTKVLFMLSMYFLVAFSNTFGFYLQRFALC
jgi:hypothetical protein